MNLNQISSDGFNGYPLIELPPTAPVQEKETLTDRQVRKIHIKDFVQAKASRSDNSCRDVMSHGDFERSLWVANCFIIPLVVYPIISILGHLFIEIMKDDYALSYKTVSTHLKDSKNLLKIEENQEMLLTDEMQKSVFKILNNLSANFDSSIEVDPLFEKLRSNIKGMGEKKPAYEIYY